MSNISVDLRESELTVCRSEDGVSEDGWSYVRPEQAMIETLPDGGAVFIAGPGFSRERSEIYCDGLYVGEARIVEVTATRGAHIEFAPMPPD